MEFVASQTYTERKHMYLSMEIHTHSREQAVRITLNYGPQEVN